MCRRGRPHLAAAAPGPAARTAARLCCCLGCKLCCLPVPTGCQHSLPRQLCRPPQQRGTMPYCCLSGCAATLALQPPAHAAGICRCLLCSRMQQPAPKQLSSLGCCERCIIAGWSCVADFASFCTHRGAACPIRLKTIVACFQPRWCVLPFTAAACVRTTSSRQFDRKIDCWANHAVDANSRPRVRPIY